MLWRRIRTFPDSSDPDMYRRMWPLRAQRSPLQLPMPASPRRRRRRVGEQGSQFRCMTAQPSKNSVAALQPTLPDLWTFTQPAQTPTPSRTPSPSHSGDVDRCTCPMCSRPPKISAKLECGIFSSDLEEHEAIEIGNEAVGRRLPARSSSRRHRTSRSSRPSSTRGSSRSKTTNPTSPRASTTCSAPRPRNGRRRTPVSTVKPRRAPASSDPLRATAKM